MKTYIKKFALFQFRFMFFPTAFGYIYEKGAVFKNISVMNRGGKTMKIYTKTGDRGETSLWDGKRVHKDSVRVESYGTVDELNSWLGFAKNFIEDEDIREKLFKVQKKLFFVTEELATEEAEKFQNRITEEEVKALEGWIDDYLKKIDKVDAFIVTGTSQAAAALHVARTVCRRAERRILALSREVEINPHLIKFVNRLSDTIYTFARFLENEVILMDFKKMGEEKL